MAECHDTAHLSRLQVFSILQKCVLHIAKKQCLHIFTKQQPRRLITLNDLNWYICMYVLRYSTLYLCSIIEIPLGIIVINLIHDKCHIPENNDILGSIPIIILHLSNYQPLKSYIKINSPT